MLFHSKAAAARIAARKRPEILNGIAPLDGADVVCKVVAAEAVELSVELEDTLALLVVLAEDVELEDDPVEVDTEPEVDEAEAVPVDATSAV